MKWVRIIFVLFMYGSTLLYSSVQSTSIQFVQTEESLTSLLKTEVWPRPVGFYGGDPYEVYAWNPSLDISQQTLTLIFVFIADYEINEVPIYQEIPISIDLEINALTLSISGVSVFLEGITSQIQNSALPAWLKSILISQYEGLELTIYPQKLLDEINDQIPSSIDFTITDISTTILDLQVGKLVWTLEIEYIINAPWLEAEMQFDGCNYIVRLTSNVVHSVRKIRLVTIWGSTVDDYDPEMQLVTDETGISISKDAGSMIATGNYILYIITYSDTGWMAYTFTYNIIEHGIFYPPSQTYKKL